MKIKVNAVLRGAEIVADPGDIIEVEEVTAKALVEAGVAEEILNVSKAVNKEVEIVQMDATEYTVVEVEEAEVSAKSSKKRR